jgi:two-component system, NarL family, response regulator NreC
VTIRVLAVDGHAVVRAGLRAILARSEIEVIGEAADGLSAMHLAEELNPGMIVIGDALPETTAVELTGHLCRARADRKVIALTACEDGESVRGMIAAGAIGYVLKRSGVDELVKAIRAAGEGTIYLDPAAGVHAVAPSALPRPEPNRADLSERECEVVRLIALGYSNKEIAARMRVSVKTVETYKSRAMEKLHIRSRVDLVRYAVRRGWLLDLDEARPILEPAGQEP